MAKWSLFQLIEHSIQEPLTLAPMATVSRETVNVSAKWTTDGVVLTQSVVRSSNTVEPLYRDTLEIRTPL